MLMEARRGHAPIMRHGESSLPHNQRAMGHAAPLHRRDDARHDAELRCSSSSLPSNQATLFELQDLISKLRERLLPFSISAVDLKGSERIDGIAAVLLSAVTAETPSSMASCPSPRTPNIQAVTAALCNLKEMALRGDLSDKLDSEAGRRLVRALCMFMDDVPESSSPLNVVCRRGLFRAQFCSLHGGAEPPESRHEGLRALLSQLLPFFEENHSDVIALFDLELAGASLLPARSKRSATFQIRLQPIPGDSGCLKHFRCAVPSLTLDASADFRSISGQQCA
jgi:hypothetical protein